MTWTGSSTAIECKLCFHSPPDAQVNKTGRVMETLNKLMSTLGSSLSRQTSASRVITIPPDVPSSVSYVFTAHETGQIQGKFRQINVHKRVQVVYSLTHPMFRQSTDMLHGRLRPCSGTLYDSRQTHILLAGQVSVRYFLTTHSMHWRMHVIGVLHAHLLLIISPPKVSFVKFQEQFSFIYCP